MTDLWLADAIDETKNDDHRRFVAARAATAPIFQFLAVAANDIDYENRKALQADRITAECARIADGADCASLANQVMSAMDNDYILMQAAQNNSMHTRPNKYDSGHNDRAVYQQIPRGQRPLRQHLLAEHGMDKDYISGHTDANEGSRFRQDVPYDTEGNRPPVPQETLTSLHDMQHSGPNGDYWHDGWSRPDAMHHHHDSNTADEINDKRYLGSKQASGPIGEFDNRDQLMDHMTNVHNFTRPQYWEGLQESHDEDHRINNDELDHNHDQKTSSKQANKYIKKQGDEWVIVQKGTGKVLSHHDSEEKANASFRAMMESKHGSKNEYGHETSCPKCGSDKAILTGTNLKDRNPASWRECKDCGNHYDYTPYKSKLSANNKTAGYDRAIDPQNEPDWGSCHCGSEMKGGKCRECGPDCEECRQNRRESSKTAATAWSPASGKGNRDHANRPYKPTHEFYPIGWDHLMLVLTLDLILLLLVVQ